MGEAGPRECARDDKLRDTHHVLNDSDGFREGLNPSCDRCLTGKSVKSCLAPFAKIFRFALYPNHFYIPRRPVPHEGRSRSSRTWDGMRWTRRRADECAERGRRSRVVLTPRRWRQVSRDIPRGDGGKRARSPGRARRKPLKPLRGECRMFSGVTVVTMLACLFYFTCEAAGASCAPGIPCALLFPRVVCITTRA